MAGANLDDDFRVDALASFSHEVRTPVTAIRMVLDLAAPAAEGAKVLDAELLGLLDTSLGELTALLDALQDLGGVEGGVVVVREERPLAAPGMVRQQARAYLGVLDLRQAGAAGGLPLGT